MINTTPEILKRLTIDEKISLLSGCGTSTTKSIEEKSIPSINMYDGPHGLRKMANSTDGMNLGLKSIEAICFPSLSAIANSWDVEIIRKIGEHMGEEAQSEDVHIVLGPGVNIKRNPLCGRNFEYFSEDPLLSGKLGAAWVNGLQSKGVGASVKHYCCNNQETNRMTVNSIVDERTLREIYLKPFEIVVKESDPATVMCSYNRLNGTYLSDNKRLLKDILVYEWGFQGFVMTDWGAMNDRAASIKARLSLEMPDSLGYFDESIKAALASGVLTERDIDECLEPMIPKIIELKNNDNRRQTYSKNEHHQFCRTAAGQSAVLLKNDGTLPFKQNEKLCVIGAFAETPRYQGTGSSRINPYKIDNLLDGLNEYNVQYEYSKGFELNGKTPESVIDDALQTAKKYDTILIAAGLPEVYESEGFDRNNMELPPVQNDLITRLCAMGKKVVVVISAGGCVEIPWTDKANSILFMGLGGEASGTACADLLLGKVNPSGKLAESWPYLYNDHIISSYWLEDQHEAFYKEGIYVGYRYFDSANINVRFPFGHGLSYTKFKYSDLKVAEVGDGFSISFRIQNTGNIDGEETAQVYVRSINGNVYKPLQELKGFMKTSLHSGENKQISIRLGKDAFTHYDTESSSWQIENGEYEIRIGASSRDIRLSTKVQVRFGIDYGETDCSWYSAPSGIPTTLDFKKIYGADINPALPYNNGTYDLNASMGEMKKDSFFVCIMCKFSEIFIAKGLGIKPDYSNPEFNMLMAVTLHSPIRNLALCSPKTMNKGLIKFILKCANGLVFNKANRRGKNGQKGKKKISA